MKKSLSAIISQINIVDIKGDPDREICGLSYDSRTLEPGELYCALPGVHVDGHKYIDSALDRGAAAVLCSRMPEQLHRDVVYIQVDNPRTAMSPLAAAFYGDPSKELKVIGVTGTDGKSSTVSFLHQLLRELGMRCGFLSTVQFNTGGESVKNHFRQSTPEASEIHKALRQMVDAGCTHAIVESTSHGLSPKNNRLGDVAFDVAVLTNISREHLEFHGTMEQYIKDKSMLFRMTAANRGIAVINRDDKEADRFIHAFNARRCYTYSSQAREDAEYRADAIQEKADRIAYRLRSQRGEAMVKLNLAGRFNIDNTLACAAAVCELEELPPSRIADALSQLKAVKGRMVPVDEGQDFQVIVDYAHTPGSFRRLFPAVRPLVKGRLFALFSSAGERDRGKRPILGEIASQYSDIIVLADEDPRGENGMELLREVAGGCTNKTEGKDLFLIEDRRKAIAFAFSMMRRDDCILLLGKGHEGSIIYADHSIDWDEETVARQLLRSV